MKIWLLILIAVGFLVYPAFLGGREGAVATSIPALAVDSAEEPQQEDSCVQLDVPMEWEAPTLEQAVAEKSAKDQGQDEVASAEAAAPSGPVALESIDYGDHAVDVLKALAQRGAIVVKGKIQDGAFQPTKQFDFGSWTWRGRPDKDVLDGGALRLITEQADSLPRPGTTVLHLPAALHAQLVQSSKGGVTRLELHAEAGGRLRVVTRTEVQQEGAVHFL